MRQNIPLHSIRNSVQSIVETDHFENWLKIQNGRTQAKVRLRLNLILTDGHFGVINYFDGIIELKWKSGLRVYSARLDQNVLVVLAGGTKNGQEKDIKKAKKLLKGIKESGFETLCNFIS